MKMTQVHLQKNRFCVSSTELLRLVNIRTILHLANSSNWLLLTNLRIDWIGFFLITLKHKEYFRVHYYFTTNVNKYGVIKQGT